MTALPQLDSLFHQPTRTRVATLLSLEAHSFSELKAALAITDGNLDAHLRKLSAAGYLHSRTVRDARPRTIYQLSDSGSKAFDEYIEALKVFVDLARAPKQ
ncbi:MAG: transcriptional regulator [Gammaproteobacteria bacterium]|nr:transcriptional regulator [Gammaproteobacteria bacterium]